MLKIRKGGFLEIPNKPREKGAIVPERKVL